jgi:hypothetical protein
MTEKRKSAKRQELEAQATEYGVAFDDSTTNGDLETAILEAMEKAVAEEAAPEPAPEAKPKQENAALEGDDGPVSAEEPEKLPPIEALHNKLVAYGVAKDECPSDIEECEMLLTQVLQARKQAAEKRQKKDEGDYFGKKAKVRITKMGDGKVSTGRYIAGIGNLCYAQDQTPIVPLLSAEALEEKGYAEILERKG